MSDGGEQVALVRIEPDDEVDRTGPEWRPDADGWRRYRGSGKRGAPQAIVQLRADSAQVIKLIRQAVCSLQESADEPDRKIRRATIAEAWGKIELSSRFLDDILTRKGRECGDTSDKPAPHVCDTCGSTALVHLDLVDGPPSTPWVMPETAVAVESITIERTQSMALSARGWIPIGEATLRLQVSARRLQLRDLELRPARDERGRRWYPPDILNSWSPPPKPSTRMLGAGSGQITSFQLARLWGVSPQCVHYHDARLQPARLPNGWRVYDLAAVLQATPPRRRRRRSKRHG